MPLVGVPKTIDNDLEATVITFGFDSAVAATDALDRLHTTAESHNRVMVLEVMGRYAGWIALYAGVAGGADVILIPEIAFTYDSICARSGARGRGQALHPGRRRRGRREKGGDSSRPPTSPSTARPGWAASAPWCPRKSKNAPARRCALRPGSFAAGRLPTNLRSRLCSIFGAEAVELVAQGKFGQMVSYQGSEVARVKITEAIGRLKTVPPTGSFARTAAPWASAWGIRRKKANFSRKGKAAKEEKVIVDQRRRDDHTFSFSSVSPSSRFRSAFA